MTGFFGNKEEERKSITLTTKLEEAGLIHSNHTWYILTVTFHLSALSSLYPLFILYPFRKASL